MRTDEAIRRTRVYIRELEVQAEDSRRYSYYAAADRFEEKADALRTICNALEGTDVLQRICDALEGIIAQQEENNAHHTK